MFNFKKNLGICCIILVIVLIVLAALYYEGMFGPHLHLSKNRFNQLPGWEQDDQSQALIAFQLSCTKILTLPPKSMFGKTPEIGPVHHWQNICQEAIKLTHPDSASARGFFEHWFIPYQVKNNFNPKGLFTGYYLPLIEGSLHADSIYTTPIYGMPNNLIRVNLGLFKLELSGKKIIGRVENQRLLPYFDRTEINNGAIKQSAPVLFWTNSPIKLFFAQIQGSTLVQLPNHERKLIGYAGENGRPYMAIGKVLIEKKALTKEKVSMETIQDWLTKNPEQINLVLNQDASYVFFKTLTGESAVGSQQVPLIPQRALAVDTHYIPLGAPIWLTTKIPIKNANDTFAPYQRLLIAQDTGGAINGIIRGDIYFGPGPEAEYMAGHMKQNGIYWILLPK